MDEAERVVVKPAMRKQAQALGWRPGDDPSIIVWALAEIVILRRERLKEKCDACGFFFIGNGPCPSCGN